MKQQTTFAQYKGGLFESVDWNGVNHSAFLLGRAIDVIEILIETGADYLAVEAAQELLADYRKWMES